MADVYDSSRELVTIGPCKWSPNLDIDFWLAQDDETILQVWARWYLVRLAPSLLGLEPGNR